MKHLSLEFTFHVIFLRKLKITWNGEKYIYLTNTHLKIMSYKYLYNIILLNEFRSQCKYLHIFLCNFKE